MTFHIMSFWWSDLNLGTKYNQKSVVLSLESRQRAFVETRLPDSGVFLLMALSQWRYFLDCFLKGWICCLCAAFPFFIFLIAPRIRIDAICGLD